MFGLKTISITKLVAALAAVQANFNLVTLQLPGTGTNNANNNTFLDSSSNNFTITRVGNTTQGTFTPYSDAAGYWSNYFDGTGDYLTVANNAALNMGGGDFTIECWFYPTATPSASGHTLFAKRATTAAFTQIQLLFVSNLTPQLYASTNGSSWGISNPAASVSCQLNSWNHIAVTRSGDTYRLFINGQVSATATLSGSLMSNAEAFSIGAGAANGGSPMTASYISNFRVVKGTAVYTAAFTPPTAPLTAVSGTSLLTSNNNRFMDSSSNNFTVTRAGDTRVQSFGPFTPARAYSTSVVGGSMYFDGSGDSLSIANNTALNLGSGNFTVEAWFRTTVDLGASSYAIHFGKWNTGAFEYLLDYNSGSLRWFNAGNAGLPIITAATTITSNTWYHVAVVRSDNTTTLYLNGVSVGTPSTNTTYTNLTAPLMIGYKSDGNGTGFYTGYISNFRLVKGTAVYTANFTPPTAPLTAVSGTSLLLSGTNAAIYDASMSTIVETAGGAKISTTVSARGSIYLDGSGDYLTAPTSDNFGYGTGDFTIELWAYMNTIAGDETIISNLTSVPSVNPHLFRNAGTLWYWTNGGERIRSANILAAQTWTHIAICRASGSTRLFVNGVQTGSTYADTNNYGSTAPLAVGTYWSGGTPVGVTTFNGYMNDVRITKGLARYTTTFTPPTRS
jgi:hypothetical protein